MLGTLTELTTAIFVYDNVLTFERFDCPRIQQWQLVNCFNLCLVRDVHVAVSGDNVLVTCNLDTV